MSRRLKDIPAGPPRLLDEFERLRTVLQEHGKYIVLLFPEYTPHDHTRHLDHLFVLADRILGKELYKRLNSSELVVLAFGLYAHDWGMAVSNAERKALETSTKGEKFDLLSGEPADAREFIADQVSDGNPRLVAWRDYLRRTHGLRSGARLRRYLDPLGSVFANSVAKVAEGHTLEIREVRNYPVAVPVFGETVNVAALATYVRMVDLLDIGDDRTPYALWKFVAPADPISKMEWKKHRALSPVAVKENRTLREVVVAGRTEDPTVFAALADLRSWVDEQFSTSIAHLRLISGKYDLDVDSRISWDVEAVGFEPVTIRFELQRPEILRLLSAELYEDDPLAFVRELLQNSVDAIDMREASLATQGLPLLGEINIRIKSTASGLHIDWADNGIGMDMETVASYFARLGVSWYRTRDAKRLGKMEPISQFGVGILSCFAVSQQLVVQTRRDPQAGLSEPGLSIEVPKRESHFRIRKIKGIPVGTKISLEVKPSLTQVVSAGAIRDALFRIARFVRHRITVDCDGIASEVPSLTNNTARESENEGSTDMAIGIAIAGMRGNSAERLSSLTTKVVFELGSAGGDYHGYYSAVVPKHPGNVIKTTGYEVWRLDGEDIALEHMLIKTEQALFVKGIQTGSVLRGTRRHRFEPHFRLGQHTRWINPTILLNVPHPSHVEFNLARSSAHLKSSEWLKDVSREIANKLRDRAFSRSVRKPKDMAIMLGSCSVFGGVSIEGLGALVGDDEIPVLVLRSGEGLVWRRLADLAGPEELVEAPFELNYANSGELRGFGDQSGLQGWEGVDAMFPTERFDQQPYPWVESVLRFGYQALRRLGWSPDHITLVQPPGKESVPLVCRVWRKCPPKAQRTPSTSWQVLRSLYENAPDILRFPDAMSRYPAIGSRYWNSQHPKMARIITALTLLAESVRQKQLSAEEMGLVSYLGSSAF